jgi:hypothetical protein
MVFDMENRNFLGNKTSAYQQGKVLICRTVYVTERICRTFMTYSAELITAVRICQKFYKVK